MNSPPTILIADDDQSLVHALTARLEAAGYEVIPALDSYQAVQAARREHPDLLLVDVNMPAGDGIELLERIEHLTHATPMRLVYLTGERSERVREAARQHGAHAVVYKPFDSRTLLQVIERALESSRHVPAGVR